jgi:hypothetical protein
VPPQVLIQELWGEANIVLQFVDINTAENLMEALGNTIGNRMGNLDFPVHSSWQAVIQGAGFDGYSRTPGAQQINTGVSPELYAAANVFSQGLPIIAVPGAGCFFSPTSTGWTAIQDVQTREYWTVPTVEHDPQCYNPISTRQFVIKRSTGTYPSGVPFFIFVRQKAESEPAVVTIDY